MGKISDTFLTALYKKGPKLSSNTLHLATVGKVRRQKELTMKIIYLLLAIGLLLAVTYAAPTENEGNLKDGILNGIFITFRYFI